MIGGFFLLTCESRDQAIALAQECPAARWATVEVRELGPCIAVPADAVMLSRAIHRTVEAVWRMESAKIIAKLARMLNQVGLAEEFAQDALVSRARAMARDRHTRQSREPGS